MAGNMSGEDTAETSIDNKFADIVSGFLLDRDIRDVCTLNEMRSNFPLKYRTHDDITVLYESFVMKRKLIKDAVQRNIEGFYTKDKAKNTNKQQQSIEEKLAVLDVKQRQHAKEMLRAKRELSLLQKNIARCDEALQNCHLLTKDVKEYFDPDLFEV